MYGYCIYQTFFFFLFLVYFYLLYVSIVLLFFNYSINTSDEFFIGYVHNVPATSDFR